jgi:serine/threonine protein kinase
MRYIHSKDIIHPDLKPANIFIDDDHRIRIGDFGSSRLFKAGVTMTNAGAPLYMAPEMDGGHYDEKVDVYSFGLIMYEIVTKF